MKTFYFTPLTYAARNGHTKVVELLLAQPGIDTNCQTIWIENFKYNFERTFFYEILK